MCQFVIAFEHAVEAIADVTRLKDLVGPHLLISEIRSIAEDKLWMSPCFNRRSVMIHFTWKPDWPAVRQVLPVIEKELAPFDPRPHWGKLFTLKREVLESRYEI